MSYTLPSVRVYQLLENSGGAARSTPDLDTVLIGPLYNIVEKEAARSLSFSKWPAAVTPVDPPTPPAPVYTLTVDNVFYYDYGMTNDVGIKFTGTSSADVGTTFELKLTAPDVWGMWEYDVMAHSTVTRDLVTGKWEAVVTDVASADLYLGNGIPEYIGILTAKYTANGQDITVVGSCTGMLPIPVRPS